jgi:hypothetical protein
VREIFSGRRIGFVLNPPPPPRGVCPSNHRTTLKWGFIV